MVSPWEEIVPTVKVNIYQAKAKLSKLVEDATEGKDVIIARAGRPVARLVPFRRRVKLGLLSGRLSVPDDFDDPLPEEVLESFEGDEG